MSSLHGGDDTTSDEDMFDRLTVSNMPAPILEPVIKTEQEGDDTTSTEATAQPSPYADADEIDLSESYIHRAINDCKCLESDLDFEVMTVNTDVPEAVLRATIDMIDDIRVKFTAAHTHLMGLFESSSKSYKLSMERRHQFLVKYKKLKTLLLGAFQPTSSDTSQNSSRLRFPRIELPEFDGKQEDWIEWRRLFGSLVHDNNQLPVFDKHQMLRTKLRGEARILIKKFPNEDKSYEPILKLLDSTYGNPTKGIASYLTSLHDLKVMAPNSKRDFRNIINTFRSLVSAIETTFQENPTLNVLSQFMIFMFLKKSDRAIVSAWELEAKRRKAPATFNEFIEFMDDQCSAGEWSYGASTKDGPVNRHPLKRKNTGATFTVSQKRSKKPCRVCEKDHPTHECPSLLTKTPQERLKFVRDKHWCFRCLHPGKTCRKKCGQYCNICKSGHNSVLHDCWPPKNATNSTNSPLLTSVSTSTLLPVSVGITQNTLYTNHVFSDFSRNDLQMEVENVNSSIAEGDCNYTVNTIVNKPAATEVGVIFSNNLNTNDISIDGWVGSLVAKNIYLLLATAIIEVEVNGESKRLKVRALLDSCSQYNIATSCLIAKINPKITKTKNTVGGIGTSSTTSSTTVRFMIYSICSNFKIEINCIVLDHLVDEVPNRSFSIDHWKIPPNVQLADPQFNVPGSIDLLLGTGVFWNVLLTQHHCLGAGLPRFQQTKFGWIVTGDINMQLCSSVGNVYCTPELESLGELSQTLERFWLIDESTTKEWSDEDRACEQHFLDTTTRTPEGRFVLRLPFKVDPSILGHSKTQALKRFQALERRFARDPVFYRQYSFYVDDLIAQGKLVQINEVADELAYYIPHHAVIKDASTSTRLRVVLDPTMKSSSGVSLNDILMKGRRVQSDIICIHSRARTRRFVFTADIKQMFLQFLRHPSDTCFQRILWRDPISRDLIVLEFTVVPFGLTSSPFEATRAVVRLVELHGDDFPLARRVLLEDIYVDDTYTGADTIEEAIETRNQLIKLLKLAGLELSKWCSNSLKIIEDLPEVANQSSFTLQYDNEMMIKTLGIRWFPQEDSYKIWVNHLDLQERYTKRQVLSIIASVFDPLGFIGPVLVLGKIIMQSLWADHLEWDSVLPTVIHKQWLEFVTTLSDLNDITIPRYLFDFNCDYSVLELHGFADASEKAYGAVVYIRSIYSSHSLMRIITSKSRVAPLKRAKLTLPRLELCAAELLADLITRIIEMYTHLKISTVRLWSDSEIALFWIRSPAERWVPFVANRVRRIKNLTKEYTWDHIGSKLNPADPLSRGIRPSELKNHELWWNGPNFLSESISPTAPGSKYKFRYSIQEELKRPSPKVDSLSLTLLDIDNNWMQDFSSLVTLITRIGYVCRFIWNCHWFGPRLYGPLQLSEYNNALLLLIQLAQREAFKDEYSRLKEGRDILKNSNLTSFFPFMGTCDVIRVGGRLRNADLSFDQRHPILLPPNHTLTKLIVRHEHLRNLHASPMLLKSILRQKYWIIHTNKVIRHCISHCHTCILSKRNARTQIMAALPRSRVTPQRAFAVSGVDYAGPVNLLIRGGPPRTRVLSKAYIAVFVCFSTKAVHLELVSDLTSESFIAAFERFISRRGVPNELQSDNGTTFVGAKRLLSDLGKSLIENTDPINQFWRTNGVNWQFIPPYAPHFGGLWEAGVKSVKGVLEKVIGDRNFTFEQYSTTLAQVEACLNSRPLVPESSDPNEVNALTPGHFLIGGPITALPNPDMSTVPANRLKYWELTKQLVQRFWQRWQNEYLNTLQERNKWRFTKDNVNVNDLVIIREDSLPPTRWAIGRITNLHPGSDGHSRVVSIKSKDGKILKRTIDKLVLLPADC